MAPAQPRAMVIGGSLGGLFTGLLLRKSGWSVDVYERVGSELSGRGAGIVTHPELVAALAAVDIHPGDELGVRIDERRTLAPDGSVVGGLRCPQTTTSWNRMFQMLRAAFPDERYHPGKEFVGFEDLSGRVVAYFADGSQAAGDLLVGADGFRSAVRGQFLPEVEPLYAGYTAWRGLVEESALTPAAHRDLFAYFAFCLPPGEQMLGYPVAGPDDDLRPGRRRYNFVWYRPADEHTELADMLTDRSGRRHSLSIPPPLIAHHVVRTMRACAERVLAPQFRDLVRATGQPFLQPIYDLESPQLVCGRVALVGDAAFVARPHVGAGVAKAAMDAEALVAALREEPDLGAALARFDAVRREAGTRIVEQARRLGSYMRMRFRDEAERALAARHRTPEAVMRETAVLDFLRG
ncbi:FAD binding domain-containing protein [Propylenella binzhouense]|uniref:FAD-dependent oxidoreductase n=1 Tax=Propylenella binzhouense TaxID=2555902 RepID=A0A964WUY7_9HYPH|nr:FAD binding domain-containing protein [Propylenella binzhouense]MYZ49581.1 FAD-dependent oxidoreductase [Propylenella binzhouense]